MRAAQWAAMSAAWMVGKKAGLLVDWTVVQRADSTASRWAVERAVQ
jgi:hypothetical protein